jgi:prephenate dehydrogenase
MPVQIALVGLGRIGGSIGMALSAHNGMQIAGFDRDPDAARVAQSRGAIHRAEWNLINAVEGADLVLIALPLSEQRDLLAALASSVREGGVIASAAPLLGPPIAWANELVPAGRFFAAAHPILNPAHLHTGEAGLDAARADLFARGLWAVAPAPGCAPEALKLVGDLAMLLGASPYFIDPAEHDGLMGGVDALPALLALALMQAATASPGWHEMRKLADRGFAAVTVPLADAERAPLTLNRDSALRYLDAAMAALRSLREKIAAGQEAALDESLAEAAALRATWLADRQRGDWDKLGKPPLEMPSAGEMVSRMLFGGLLPRKREQKKGQ